MRSLTMLLVAVVACGCSVSPDVALSVRVSPTPMKSIPAGEFTMGSESGMPNEQPTRRVRVDAFVMDEHPVTNAQFYQFVQATGYRTTAEQIPNWEELRKQLPPGTPKPDAGVLVPGSAVFVPPSRPVPLDDVSAWWQWTPGASWQHPEGPQSAIATRMDHPVVHVSWDDAVAYATWAQKRLPTEAEWEYAARGGLDGKRFSWGDELKPDGRTMANIFQGDFPHHSASDDGFERTSPVKTFPPNGYGLYDMAGNVWQWTADWYQSTDDSGRATRRVIKGGSFLCHESYCESYRPSARRGAPGDTGSSHVGFRLVRDAS